MGGKLRLATVAGVEIDVGAESMLARRPEAVGLAAELGLEVVHPASGSSQLWTRGSLRPLPRTLLGVPLDPADLAASGVLSDEGLERATHETALPLADQDVSVGELLGARLGPEVVDRLAEPLLGGVYAGHAANLSARPRPSPRSSRSCGSTGRCGAAAAAVPPASDAPVFAGARGRGRTAAASALAAGLDVRTSAPVRELARTSTGFRLTVGSTRDSGDPGDGRAWCWRRRARRRLGCSPTSPRRPRASSAAVEYASMAIVTLARAEPWTVGDVGSGFLVPPVDGRRIKAATYSFAKWGWVRRGRPDLLHPALPRSAGTARRRRSSATDEELVARVARRPRATRPGSAVRPVDAHVQRWGGALPQYAVGHLDRVAPDPGRGRRRARAGGVRRGVRRCRASRPASRRPAGRPACAARGSNEAHGPVSRAPDA